MFMSKLLFFVIASCIACTAQGSPVKLVLYYEGLCPGCHQFILSQLYPGYQQLGDDALSVELIPYGNADYTKNADGSVDFDCQHGPNECLINRIHACAINLETTQAKLLNFVNCDLAGSTSTNTSDELVATAKQCAELAGLPFDEINNCVTSSLSGDLLVAYADRQAKLKPLLQYVPNIRFDDKWNTFLQDDAVSDLVGTVCDLLDGPKPSVCSKMVKPFYPRKLKQSVCKAER